MINLIKILCLFFVLLSFIYNQESLEIYNLSNYPAVDGILDYLYPEEAGNIDKADTLHMQPEDEDDLSGWFNCGWYEDSLYFYVTVIDDIIKTENHTYWANDNIWFYFDGDNSKSEIYDGLDDVNFCIEVDDQTYNDISVGGSTLPWFDSSSIHYKTQITDNGWKLEIAFNFEDISIDNDVPFGFDIQIDDSDEEIRETILLWYSGTIENWYSPSLFGTASLSDSQYAAVDPDIVIGEQNIIIYKDTLHFGEVVQNETKSIELAVHNKGTETLIISNIISGNDNFTISPENLSLDSLTAELFTIQFTPSSIGPVTTPLSFISNDPDSGVYIIVLTGTGIVEPEIAISMDSLNIELSEGESINQNITIYNHGGDNLQFHVSSIEDSNNISYQLKAIKNNISMQDLYNNPDGFTFKTCLKFSPPLWLSIDPDSGTVPANDSLTINIVFDASGLIESEYRAQIFVSSNDPDLSEIEIPVTLIVTATSAIEDPFAGKIPETYVLYQNYPNPFNPITHIRYGMPESNHVQIILYNILGQCMSILEDQYKNAGYHTINFNASNLSSGMYIYKIKAGNFTKVMKMLVLK